MRQKLLPKTSAIRHCRKVNKSSLYSVPHWNCIRLHLPKGSGGFRSPKASLLVCVNVTAGNTKKRENPVDTSKLDPAVFPLFFLSVSRTRSRKRDRPAVRLVGSPRGKRYVLCGGLHLITACGGASPQGEAFRMRTSKQGLLGQVDLGFPLRGSCH